MTLEYYMSGDTRWGVFFLIMLMSMVFGGYLVAVNPNALSWLLAFVITITIPASWAMVTRCEKQLGLEMWLIVLVFGMVWLLVLMIFTLGRT